MVKTLILYESKYGFTEKAAKDLSLILGPAKCCRVSEFKGDGSIYDAIVILTPIYADIVDQKVTEYISQNTGWLKQKKVILICTCMADNIADKYLKPLKDMLGQSIVMEHAITGEINIHKLDKPDYDSIMKFCKITGVSLDKCKPIDRRKFVELALSIKNIKDKGGKVIVEKELKSYVDDFLKNHNTCTLSTAHDISVRATPIEYIYKDEYFYILSEGGEKFANILLNPNVSMCIYDPYKSMSELGGMQVTGTAQIIDTGSNEYKEVLENKGIEYHKIISLPVALNLIKIEVKKIEFLWSEFIKLGYDVKQVLYKE